MAPRARPAAGFPYQRPGGPQHGGSVAPARGLSCGEVRVANFLHVAAALDQRLLGGGALVGSLIGGCDVLFPGGQGDHSLRLGDRIIKVRPGGAL